MLSAIIINKISYSKCNALILIKIFFCDKNAFVTTLINK